MSGPKYFVSACLAGCACRYDGKSKTRDELKELVDSGRAIAVCPEELGELPTPRPPAEIKNNRVISCLGKDISLNYHLGALRALQIAEEYKINEFFLKSKSPMCGFKKVYDGSFSGKLTEGHGIFSSLLLNKKFIIHEVE